MKKVRVLVVDDSAYSRRTITKMLEEIGNVEVVGYAANGEEGIQRIITHKPDLITLDLEMPKMDGFTLLRIITSRYSIPVIVISALSGADKVFKALELGALDFIAKPSNGASTDLITIKDDLCRKVRQIPGIKVSGGRTRQPLSAASDGKPLPPRVPPAAQQPVDLVAIGASTGGPPALQKLFSSFDKRYPFSVIVSQHMPSGFTRAFAERLDKFTPFDVKEAEDGDQILPGRILIAPGGTNLITEVQGGQVVARIVPPSPSDRYLPSVDVMLESCSGIYKKRLIAVILTGMGNDGSKGVKAVKQHSGHVIAESEDSAVVYGMPREAVATGLVDKIVPLHRVSREILVKGGFM